MRDWESPRYRLLSIQGRGQFLEVQYGKVFSLYPFPYTRTRNGGWLRPKGTGFVFFRTEWAAVKDAIALAEARRQAGSAPAQ